MEILVKYVYDIIDKLVILREGIHSRSIRANGLSPSILF